MYRVILCCILLISSNVFCQNKDQKQKFDVKKMEKQLFKITKFDDLVNLGVNIHNPGSLLTPQKITGRKTGSFEKIVDANNVKDATPGKCDPKPVCISNPLTETVSASNQVVYPPCINIHRCDGCCPQDEKCVAVKSDTIRLKNVGIINITLNEMVYEGSSVIVQNHTECECRCQWETDEDCKKINPNFIRSMETCACVCPNAMRCGAYHEFDVNSCKCICNKKSYSKIESNCKSRGMKWNEETCKCESKAQLKIEITKN